MANFEHGYPLAPVLSDLLQKMKFYCPTPFPALLIDSVRFALQNWTGAETKNGAMLTHKVQ